MPETRNASVIRPRWSLVVCLVLGSAFLATTMMSLAEGRVSSTTLISLVVSVPTLLGLIGWLYFSLRAVRWLKERDGYLGTVLDIAALMPVLTLFACGWWAYFSVDPRGRTGGSFWALPAALQAFAADGLPFVMGYLWLSLRHAASLRRRFDPILLLLALVLLVTLGIAMPFFLWIAHR